MPILQVFFLTEGHFNFFREGGCFITFINFGRPLETRFFKKLIFSEAQSSGFFSVAEAWINVAIVPRTAASDVAYILRKNGSL